MQEVVKDKQIIKIENFLPNRFHYEIKDLLFSKNFPWHFLENTAYSNSNEEYFSFCLLTFDQTFKSRYFDFFYPMIYFIPNNENIEIVRHRIALNTKIYDKKTVQNLGHIDQEFEHKTILYYVNDSDGDTLFYDNSDCKNVIFSNTPQENTALLFDGDIFHSSAHPSKVKARITININYVENT